MSDRRSIAVALVAALIVTGPGNLTLEAAAQTMRSAVTEVGGVPALGAGIGSVGAPAFSAQAPTASLGLVGFGGAQVAPLPTALDITAPAALKVAPVAMAPTAFKPVVRAALKPGSITPVALASAQKPGAVIASDDPAVNAAQKTQALDALFEGAAAAKEETPGVLGVTGETPQALAPSAAVKIEPLLSRQFNARKDGKRSAIVTISVPKVRVPARTPQLERVAAHRAAYERAAAPVLAYLTAQGVEHNDFPNMGMIRATLDERQAAELAAMSSVDGIAADDRSDPSTTAALEQPTKKEKGDSSGTMRGLQPTDPVGFALAAAVALVPPFIFATIAFLGVMNTFKMNIVAPKENRAAARKFFVLGAGAAVPAVVFTVVGVPAALPLAAFGLLFAWGAVAAAGALGLMHRSIAASKESAAYGSKDDKGSSSGASRNPNAAYAMTAVIGALTPVIFGGGWLVVPVLGGFISVIAIQAKMADAAQVYGFASGIYRGLLAGLMMNVVGAALAGLALGPTLVLAALAAAAAVWAWRKAAGATVDEKGASSGKLAEMSLAEKMVVGAVFGALFGLMHLIPVVNAIAHLVFDPILGAMIGAGATKGQGLWWVGALLGLAVPLTAFFLILSQGPFAPLTLLWIAAAWVAGFAAVGALSAPFAYRVL